MTHTTRLAYLMKLSWEIERKKHCSRAKALQAAWAITTNEDITICYLVKRHSTKHSRTTIKPQQIQLFSNQ